MRQTAELTPTAEAQAALTTYLRLRRQADIDALRKQVGNAQPKELITMQFHDDIPTFTILMRDFDHILTDAHNTA